jgi:hypothetical protein
MSRLPKPELRMPQIGVPLFLADLFYDLRDRRLLPFLALVVVALVAVPFLLSNSSGSSPEEEAPPPVAGASDGGAAAAQLTVVQTDHGLREPQKRLAHRAAKDPFRQQYTGPSGGGSEVTQTSTSTSSTSVPTETGSSSSGGAPSATSPTSPSTPQTTQPSGAGSTEAQPVTVFTFAIDLKMVKATPKKGGGTSKGKPEERQRVLPATTLPGKKRQVVTYLGISPKHKKPLLLVSPEVSSVFGEAQCVAGSASCQLVEVEPHFPITFVYGPNDVRYKLTVLSVKPVASGHL